MFPTNKAEDFFPLTLSEAREALTHHTSRAVSFMYGSQHWEDQDGSISVMYLRRVCFQVTVTLNKSPPNQAFALTPINAFTLMRMFPHARFMLQAFGEDSTPTFLECLSVYTTGCMYVADERHHRLMASQYARMFGQKVELDLFETITGPRSPCGPPMINQIPRTPACPQCSVVGNSHACHDNYHLQFK